MPTGRGFTLIADIPDGERRDGGPELVIRGKHPVIAMPKLLRPGHEVSESIEKLPRREINDAVLSRCGGRALPAGADPLAALVTGQRVADAFGADATAGEEGEPLEREGGPGTVSEEMLEAPEVARHVAVDQCVADARIDRKAAATS